MKIKKNNNIMILTIIGIWVGVAFAYFFVYELLKPKDQIIVYKPLLPITEGFRELEPPF
jgi:hypothetical protein